MFDHLKECTASCSSDLVTEQASVHSVVRILIGAVNSIYIGTAVIIHDLSNSWLDVCKDAPGQTDLKKLQVVGISLA